MKQIILVFIGGGFGSVLRFIIGKWLNSNETGIPYGTFATNILGSLLIGIILGLAAKNDSLSQNQTLLLATGFCGGFTTFSTFAMQSQGLLFDQKPFQAILYLTLSVVVGVVLAYLGLKLAK